MKLQKYLPEKGKFTTFIFAGPGKLMLLPEHHIPPATLPVPPHHPANLVAVFLILS